jgi:hypothetical protein
MYACLKAAWFCLPACQPVQQRCDKQETPKAVRFEKLIAVGVQMAEPGRNGQAYGANSAARAKPAAGC